MSVIKVFEYERLAVDQKGFTGTHFDALVRFNERNKNKYFTVVHKGIKFSNYVGVIQVGNLTLEILPKADRESNPSEELKDKWHSVLIEMLKTCRLLNLESLTDASLKTSQTTLLDIYLNLFLSECDKLMHEGLIKKYRHETSNVTALKGSIQFSGHIKHNLIHKERFYTKHQTYDFDNLLNQILQKALRICGTISTTNSIVGKSKILSLYFPEINDKFITINDFQKLQFDRKSIRYEKAISLAKLIILNYNPDLRKGDLNVLALLFDMNKLWEDYIYRMLLRSKPEGVSINFQNSQKFWENKTIRPDLVVTKNDGVLEEKYIIDTKWKIIDHSNPPDDDLKQMYAYNLYWNAGKSMLLYPKVDNFIETFGVFHKGRDNGNACKLGFINVLDDTGKLDYGIGKLILEKLN